MIFNRVEPPLNRIKLFLHTDRKYYKSIEMQDAIFDKIFLDFSQKSVLKWIELLGLDRIGLRFYTKKKVLKEIEM